MHYIFTLCSCCLILKYCDISDVKEHAFFFSFLLVFFFFCGDFLLVFLSTYPFTCRFTSDVKIKSIAVVGGADGTSPSRMRA
jgi:hypothetical protein